MQKFSYLLSLLGTMAFAATETDNSLLKGVLIVDESSKIREEGLDQIKGIQFDGIAQNEELIEELSPFLSEFPLTANGAEALCSAITTYYHEHDDMRVAVTLPDQNTSEGVVQLVVAPERLGKLNVKENKYTRPETLKRWVRLSTADPINEKTMAQDLGWMNTNPYRTVKANYQLTDQPGITDIDLVVSDKKNWKISTGVDNTGTNPIGTTRIFAGVNVNDFIFADHTFKLQATTADHWKEFQNYTAEYVAPMPWRNTVRVFGSYSSTKPNRAPYPQKHKESFQASGRYAIPQWFGANIWVDQLTYEAGVDFKGTDTNVFFENNADPVKRMLAFTGQLAANISALRNRGGNKITAGLDLIGSPARMLPHQSDEDYNNLRAGAKPQYLYSKLAMTVEQKFLQSWSLFFQGRGQFAFADLIPSEQFSLGGYSTVRGYAEKAVGGDNAVCGNLEIRSPEFTVAGIWVPKFGDKLSFLGFADGGYAWFRSKVEDTPLEQGLLSVGPGMRYSVASNFTSRLDVGFPLTKVEKDTGKPHIHFNAILSY